MSTVSVYRNAAGVPGTLEINQPTHAGGEGQIYFSTDGKYAVKIYHEQKATIEKRQHLERIRELGEWLSPAEKSFLVWPLGLVKDVDGRPQVGSVTRRLPSSFVQLILVNQNALAAKKQFQSGRLWSHYLQIARGVANAVDVLNSKGCAHTDLNNRNFMVNPETCEVGLIDLDGVVVPGFLPPQVGGTPGFMAREVAMGQTKPNEMSDRHSLAVQVLLTLLFRNVFQPLVTYDIDLDRDERIGWSERLAFSEDTHDPSNRLRNLGLPLFKGGSMSYRVLTPALQKLVERACLVGISEPTQRPGAKEWIDTLSYALDELYNCAGCGHHVPYPHWLPTGSRRCPLCGRPATGPLPSVLSLYEPKTPGKYAASQRFLVMTEGWRLFSDVLDAPRPPMTRQRERSAGYVQFDSKRNSNRLINEENSAWQVRVPGEAAVGRVSRGGSVALTPGTIIQFGTGRRLAVVNE